MFRKPLLLAALAAVALTGQARGQAPAKPATE